jgi:hypothetical protein
MRYPPHASIKELHGSRYSTGRPGALGETEYHNVEPRSRFREGAWADGMQITRKVCTSGDHQFHRYFSVDERLSTMMLMCISCIGDGCGVGGMSEIEQLKSSNNRAKLRLDLFKLLRSTPR